VYKTGEIRNARPATSTFEGIDIAASLLTALLPPQQQKKLKFNLAVWTNKEE